MPTSSIRMKAAMIMAFSILLASCAESNMAFQRDVPAAAIQESGENTFLIRFSGRIPVECKIVSSSGEEWVYMAARDGDSIRTEGLLPGDYSIFVIDRGRVACMKNIRIR